MNDMIMQVLASGMGSGSVVLIVMKIYFNSLNEKISDAKKTATRAHSRIDRILNKNH